MLKGVSVRLRLRVLMKSKTEIKTELEEIHENFNKKRKFLTQIQNKEGVTKIVFGSCFMFNLGNELNEKDFKRIFS